MSNTTTSTKSCLSALRNGTPTLGQMIAESQRDQRIIEEADNRIERATKAALEAWFRQSYRLYLAYTFHCVHGRRFVDFASRIGIHNKSDAYYLRHLHQWRKQIMARIDVERGDAEDAGERYAYPGWRHALEWFQAHRYPKARGPHNDQDCRSSPRHSAHVPVSLPREKNQAISSSIYYDDFPTPAKVFARFGADCTLDVAASRRNSKCKHWFTKKQNGLKRKWYGIVWMNAPYRDLMEWCKKAVEYARSGGRVIALLPAWTDAAWFHDYVPFGRVTLLRSRLSFRNPNASGNRGCAPFGSMIVEWSPETLNRASNNRLDVYLDRASH
jgi:phage N-6-adenine-methyltransferase